MDQIEVSICMSMSGMSFQPTSTEKTNSRQYVQESHQASYSGLTHHTNSSNAQVIVVPNGNVTVQSHSSASSKAAYLASASTTPTDLMDVVSSASYVGAY